MSVVPLIGITGHVTETAAGRKVVAANEPYVTAVRLAGGFPVLLPPVYDRAQIDEALAHVDGVLLTGGKDVDPAHYGETILNSHVAPEPERDAYELPLAVAAYQRAAPLLGICRGMQVINVALGGSLWQDLPAQVPTALPHYQKVARDEMTHQVEVEQDSLVGDLTVRGNGRLLPANSFHHQAARSIAPSLVAVAHAPDGVVEAVEAPDRDYLIGVQWHPEHLAATHDPHRRIFEGLVEAARRFRARRLHSSV
ncbi:MAG TPA: gamma-glutamyl-gamma-aminobutyrate hydrolase family protein [Chloroflexota bacterium]|nr:gamma-glutamyl-gamma-aminobutyrate hydrolase family protein [Chloroflexota bacterium]